MYLRLVFFSSRRVVVSAAPARINQGVGAVIYANWHGNNLMFSFFFRNKPRPNALVALHGDGQMVGNAVRMLGVRLIHGSGSPGKSDPSKGGARAFLRMLKALKSAQTVSLTADIPKMGRIVGDGIILLARKSGAPIVPAVVASSRRKILGNWDRTQIHLPFSKLVFVLGAPIDVPDDGSALEPYRVRLQSAMDSAQIKAFALADDSHVKG